MRSRSCTKTKTDAKGCDFILTQEQATGNPERVNLMMNEETEGTTPTTPNYMQLEPKGVKVMPQRPTISFTKESLQAAFDIRAKVLIPQRKQAIQVIKEKISMYKKKGNQFKVTVFEKNLEVAEQELKKIEGTVS